MSDDFYPGDVISYIEMCQTVGASLQRGMNYRLCGKESVILMSRRVGAPYEDEIDETGTILNCDWRADANLRRECRSARHRGHRPTRERGYILHDVEDLYACFPEGRMALKLRNDR